MNSNVLELRNTYSAAFGREKKALALFSKLDVRKKKIKEERGRVVNRKHLEAKGLVKMN